MPQTRTLASLAVVSLVAVALGAAAVTTTRAADARVERGRYLVAFAACGDCHTPLKDGPNGPAPDLSRALSGHPESLKMSAPPTAKGAWIWSGAATNTAFAGPWGVSYAANLTPDANTGLGIWTEAMFVDAMRSGKHMGKSRPIMPPMPWESIKGASDEDLKAIYAYLRTLKPIVNHVPDYQPPAGSH